MFKNLEFYKRFLILSLVSFATPFVPTLILFCISKADSFSILTNLFSFSLTLLIPLIYYFSVTVQRLDNRVTPWLGGVTLLVSGSALSAVGKEYVNGNLDVDRYFLGGTFVTYVFFLLLNFHYVVEQVGKDKGSSAMARADKAHERGENMKDKLKQELANGGGQ